VGRGEVEDWWFGLEDPGVEIVSCRNEGSVGDEEERGDGEGRRGGGTSC